MSNKQVLVVDDNPLSRKLMSNILGAEGYSVRNAASGGEALATIAKERPDLVLLDIMMPGMDGFEVVRQLKANAATRSIPVVIVTALDDEGARTRLATAGVNLMLNKPINRWELRSLMSRILSNPTEKKNEQLPFRAGD